MANKIVKLNVGGVFYTTTRTTLCTYPDAMLGAMFNGTIESTKDENGCYFIDRDGELFKYILNFLRSSELAVPKDITVIQQLRLEASFYQIMPLVKIIDDLLLPTQLEYIVIEHMKNETNVKTLNKITIRGTDDLITKYFRHLGKTTATQTDTIYATLILDAEGSHGSLSYGKVLCNDGWKLASTTSVATESHNDYTRNLTTINKDTWKLEK